MKVVRDQHVLGAQVVHGPEGEPAQTGVETAAHDVQHVLDTRLTVGRETPEVRAADHDRPGAEGDRLQHVRAATYAAVHHHVDLAADTVGYRLDHADGGRGAVEVVAAVVGDRDARDPRIDRPQRVVHAADPLEHERCTRDLRP